MEFEGDTDTEISSDAKENWYDESDTAEDIPDPNEDASALYQDENMLPTPLENSHFEEGLLYTITMRRNKELPMLAMIISAGDEDFTYRVFFAKSSQLKTYHKGAKDRRAQYEDVWRLAPRRELQQPFQHDKAFIGQTLRYKYETVQYTVCVLARYSRSIRGRVICGPHSGEIQSFELIEISNCYELFGSALLQNLFTQTKEAEWSDAKKSRTRQIPVRKPKLNPEFEVPPAEQNKRL